MSKDSRSIGGAETSQLIERCGELIKSRGLGGVPASPSLPKLKRFKYSYHLCFEAPPSVASATDEGACQVHAAAEHHALRVKIQALPSTTNVEEALTGSHLLRAKADAEYRSLVEVWQLFGDRGPDHSALRPLEMLEPWGAIAMEELSCVPLRSRLEGFRRGHLEVSDRRVFERAGAWLRRLHLAGPCKNETLPIEKLAFELEELNREVDDETFKVTLARVGTLLKSLEGRQAPVARVHGDYHPENVLVTPEGRVAGIDLWPGPDACVYRDLATLLTYTPLVKFHQVTRGLLLSRFRHDEFVAGAVAGYFQKNDFDRAALGFFCALRVLCKWRDNAVGGRSTGFQRWAPGILMAVKQSQYLNLIQYWLDYSKA